MDGTPGTMLRLTDIGYTLGGAPILEGAELTIAPGDRLCVVGRNGSGKSTLLRIAAGLLVPQDGVRFVQPGTTIRYLPQEPDFGAHDTVLDYVLAGLGPADAPHRARALLQSLGLPENAAPVTLSGGEARRAALARTLAPCPDLLLLDEPTNHLDLPAIEWLELELAQSAAAIVLISHDRRLLERVARGTVWLDRGRTRRLDRGFAQFEGWRDALLAEEETARHKLARKIAREEDWMRYGVTARRKRNVRRVAELAELRQRRREWRQAPGEATLIAAVEQGSGALVAVAEGASVAFGERPIVRDLNLRLRRGDRLGIVGANGAGKTTLLRLLTGELPPDQGEIRLGTNLVRATLDQARASLDASRTLADTLTGGASDTVEVRGQKRHVIGYMKDFLFRPEQARTPVGVLSGGERARLLLAVALARPANLLVLDEPTNDLDLETLDLLQEMLADYAGTVLLVSHDRDFLDRLVTATLAAEGGGFWVEYAGGYTDMLLQRRPAAVAEADARTKKDAPARMKRPGPERLSFKERFALQHLPRRIEALSAEIGGLQRLLSDADYFGRDATAARRSGMRLARAEAELEQAEAEWLELELRREALESRPA